MTFLRAGYSMVPAGRVFGGGDMPSVGPTELIIVLVIVLIIFGVGKLPEIGGAMGKAIREFRTSQSGQDEATAKSESDVESGAKKG